MLTDVITNSNTFFHVLEYDALHLSRLTLWPVGQQMMQIWRGCLFPPDFLPLFLQLVTDSAHADGSTMGISNHARNRIWFRHG